MPQATSPCSGLAEGGRPVMVRTRRQPMLKVKVSILAIMYMTLPVAATAQLWPSQNTDLARGIDSVSRTVQLPDIGPNEPRRLRMVPVYPGPNSIVVMRGSETTIKRLPG